MTNICDIIVSNFIAVIVVLLVVFCICYPDQIPTFTFTAITAGFAYQAYKYTKEKFRLELFEKRWEIYDSIVSFNSTFLIKKGDLDITKYKDDSELTFPSDFYEDLKLVTEKAFGHQRKFLFGSEIQIRLDEINQIYRNSVLGETNSGGRLKSYLKMYSFSSQLPDLFFPYLYFGDYKSNMQQERNLCELCVLCGEKFKNLLGFKSQKGQT